jgi:hypothetical protein
MMIMNLTHNKIMLGVKRNLNVDYEELETMCGLKLWDPNEVNKIKIKNVQSKTFFITIIEYR